MKCLLFWFVLETRLKRNSVHKRELNVDNIGKYSDGRSPSIDAVSKSYFTSYAVILVENEPREMVFGAKIHSAFTALITI